MADANKSVTVGGIDMHKMVDTLRKQKMSHDSAIERLTLKELREKVSQNTQPMLILLFL